MAQAYEDELMHATVSEQTMQRTADAATAVAIGATSISWVAEANQILQLVATVVAIVSGSFAAYYYYTKARTLKDE